MANFNIDYLVVAGGGGGGGSAWTTGGASGGGGVGFGSFSGTIAVTGTFEGGRPSAPTTRSYLGINVTPSTGEFDTTTSVIP